MSYYRGDYYKGDYYRGDPGFWSVLGGIAKSAVGFIPGVGPALSKGIEAVSSVAGAGRASTAIVKREAGPAATLISRMKGGVLKHPVLTGAGAAGIAGAAAGIAGTKLLSRGAGMRKRRRMRATNTKALRRALRRAYAFERIAMKTIKLVHPRKKGHFGGFKRPKKRVC
jgi:hypothetical protein